MKKEAEQCCQNTVTLINMTPLQCNCYSATLYRNSIPYMEM